ncbi:MAG: TonB-dependent receptor [Bacteroidales bacterium]|nr:TonB-dependent receptor [Bacteroidales bacterium]
MIKLIIYIVIIFSGISLYGQKNVSISGFVYDKSTGEILIGATIYEKKSKIGTITNEYGFYSLTMPSYDSLEIYVSFLGYKQLMINLPSNQKKQLDFYLTSGIALGGVTITATKEGNIVKRNETGVVRLPMKEIKALPNLFGEVDIVKAYQLTPGVQSGGEAKSNLYVRGGSPDQNLILLDDVPLYYVAHFGGFFSVFNADAINDVKLIKGGFPARYGSRLSSVLDIRMKEGNMKKKSVQGTVGLLSSKISLEGPIIKNKLSFIVSARKNLIPIFKIMGTGLSYNFYDLNAKLNYRLSTKDKLFFSYYMGDDILSMNEKTDISNHNSTVKWGNTLLAFRWNHIYNNKLFSNLTFLNTYYRYKNIFEYNIDTDSISKSMNNSLLTGINDLSLKVDFTYLINSKLNFKFGANSIYHTFIPDDEHFSQSGTDIVSINENYSSVANALENAVYLENELKFNRINTNLGLRYSSYHIGSSNYYSFEPRILLNYILREDLSIKYSFSKMNQYVHLLTYSGTGIPSDYWMPTNENVKPENSIQNSLGIAKTFFSNKYEFSIETYHKTLNDLITFIPGESLLGNLDNWENVIEMNGKGLNYGIELFLQKKTGKTTGWVGATVAKAEREFVNVNNGKTYPFKYDRLLDLSIVVNHKLKKNIVLSTTWTYGTGYPITLATEHYTINGEDIFVYAEKNSYRMRDYHRLDIAANFNKKTKWGERTWTVSIFNVYNRQNPYYYYYGRELKKSTLNNTGGGYSFTPEYGELKLYQKSLFSIFPSVSYSFKF